MVNRVIKEGFPKASLEAHSRFWPTRASAARHQIAFPVSQDGSNPSRHCPPPHAPQTEAEINDAQEGRGQRALAAEQFCAFKPFIQYPECHPARQRVSGTDRKSTRLNSSHVSISYAVFCLKKKIK